MITKVNWCCFISQSGSEVLEIARHFCIVPKVVLTNNPKKLKPEVAEWLKENGCEMRVMPFKPGLEQYLQEDILSSNIITLHGYLRILPKEFIESYSPKKIYNGHPGLITHFPELKGKDPQIRAWEGKYPLIGSVVHEVTPGVDEGEVIKLAMSPNTAESLEDMYLILRQTSLRSWIEFFKENASKLLTCG